MPDVEEGLGLGLGLGLVGGWGWGWVAWALVALALVYLYAAAALWAHGRLGALAPPRSLARAVLVGLATPACGCTALPYARRAPPALRGPFLAAAYAGNPLLVVAALALAGPAAALAVAALAAAAALAARALPAPSGGAAPLRLADLLIRRDASVPREAAAYAREFGAPALALGALVGLAASWPAPAGGAVVAALAALFAPPRREVALDHGARFAWSLAALHLAFAVAAGAAVAALAARGA